MTANHRFIVHILSGAICGLLASPATRPCIEVDGFGISHEERIHRRVLRKIVDTNPPDDVIDLSPPGIVGVLSG
jgi:L-serine deaminase